MYETPKQNQTKRRFNLTYHCEAATTLYEKLKKGSSMEGNSNTLRFLAAITITTKNFGSTQSIRGRESSRSSHVCGRRR